MPNLLSWSVFFSVFLCFSFLPLLQMFLFCLCCTKLKLHAKEKITEAATDEARLFAPLEQVDLYYAFTCLHPWNRSLHGVHSHVCTLGTGVPLYGCTLGTDRSVHGMLSNICTLGTGRSIWHAFMFATVEQIHYAELPNFCTHGRVRSYCAFKCLHPWKR
jgi:hypothetical protein